MQNTCPNDISWLFRPRYLLRLLMLMIAGAIISFAATSPGIIRPVYQTETIIYVPLTLFIAQYSQLGIGFASDDEIAGHIQILRSNQVLDSLIVQFRLDEVYGIDKDYSGWSYRIYRRAASNISIDKNRYKAVSIKVRDREAERAAGMANALIGIGDSVKADILQENRLQALAFAERQYLESQPETALFDERKQIFEALVLSLETPLPASYVVSRAVVPHKPVWPKRPLVALVTSLVFALAALFVEIIKKDAQ